MISFDVLYLLLLIELICLFAGAGVYFFIKKQALRRLYLGVLKELSSARQIEADLKKQLAAVKSGAEPKPQVRQEPAAQPDRRIDELKKQLLDAQAALSDKSEKMEQLQVKFSDLEKEYMILYHQQQKQQGGG
jgi:hypothetical protein